MRAKICFTVFLSAFAMISYAKDTSVAWTSEFVVPEPDGARREYQTLLYGLFAEERVSLNINVLSEKGILLPIGGRQFRADTVSHRKRDVPGRSGVWYGRVEGYPFLSVITYHKEKVRALILFQEGGKQITYEVLPVKQYNLLRQVTLSQGVDDAYRHPTVNERTFTPVVGKGRRRAVSPGDSNCKRGLYSLYTVDLLYLYDETTFQCGIPDSPELCLDMDALITKFQHWTDVQNAVLVNSRIFHGRYKFVGVEKRDVTTDLDLYGELDWLVNHPWAMDMREKHAADNAIFVVGGRASTAAGLNAGWLSLTFTGVNWRVISHELGHGLGENHQKELYPDMSRFTFADDYSFAYYVDWVFRTVMNNDDPNHRCPGCDDIPAYSNPSVLYGGVPIGIPGERDNARKGREKIKEASEIVTVRGTQPQCVSLTELQIP